MMNVIDKKNPRFNSFLSLGFSFLSFWVKNYIFITDKAYLSHDVLTLKFMRPSGLDYFVFSYLFPEHWRYVYQRRSIVFQ